MVVSTDPYLPSGGVNPKVSQKSDVSYVCLIVMPALIWEMIKLLA